jgi:hypothetical protein
MFKDYILTEEEMATYKKLQKGRGYVVVDVNGTTSKWYKVFPKAGAKGETYYVRGRSKRIIK